MTFCNTSLMFQPLSYWELLVSLVILRGSTATCIPPIYPARISNLKVLSVWQKNEIMINVRFCETMMRCSSATSLSWNWGKSEKTIQGPWLLGFETMTCCNTSYMLTENSWWVHNMFSVAQWLEILPGIQEVIAWNLPYHGLVFFLIILHLW